jgi:hypothetical protein
MQYSDQKTHISVKMFFSEYVSLTYATVGYRIINLEQWKWRYRGLNIYTDSHKKNVSFCREADLMSYFKGR